MQDINDNSPVFTQKSYYASVAENAQLNPPAAVLQVNAVDADDGIFGEVKYAVVGNDNTMFQLDPNSGILYPSQSLKGKTGQYKMSVEARDGLGFGPNADKADVVIDVQTVNNYRPIFIMPALSNASVEIQEVCYTFSPPPSAFCQKSTEINVCVFFSHFLFGHFLQFRIMQQVIIS